MIRGLLVAAVVSLCMMGSGTATAASNGSGSHESGHAARSSSGSKRKASTKPGRPSAMRCAAFWGTSLQRSPSIYVPL